MTYRIKYPSFTLVEILLVVAILSITATVGIGITNSSLAQSELQSATENIVSILRRTQTKARANESNLPQGLAINETEIIFFEGSSLATATLTETHGLSNGIQTANISLTGEGNEILFEPYTGETENTGTFQLTDGNPGNTSTISISSLGLIQW